ncbi:terpenoid cyclases/protein prenyltransferase alpha-alpha toroid [Pisolithus marmoratus]|nr:terpenoid cyclases/protein prenyltransferase alpha-alpha toroid [Pisolithus marmoratus]
MAYPQRSPDDHYLETESILYKHLPTNPESPPPLQRNQHLQFLVKNLVQGIPIAQPWLLFWTLQSFSVLGVALDPDSKQKAIDTIMTWQHPDGGFGGGPGQQAHLLPTYASVCALAIVGRPGPGGGWDQIDREKMYEFFMSLKQTRWIFSLDVREYTVLLVVAHLLDILTPDLLDGKPAFIASCQTYEGGFSCASQPYFQCLRQTKSTAHGGYTFCALASWIVLQPYLRLHGQTGPRPFATQLNLVDSGGRTNKLVDGCYSWWVGGGFTLLASQGIGGGHGRDTRVEWDDVEEPVWSKLSLQRYILCAGQHPSGGLRDKPPKPADSYHTLYCLVGLSTAQHNVYLSQARRAHIAAQWRSPPELRKTSFLEALSWAEEEGGSHILGSSANRVNATHPIFSLTMTHTEALSISRSK